MRFGKHGGIVYQNVEGRIQLVHDVRGTIRNRVLEWKEKQSMWLVLNEQE